MRFSDSLWSQFESVQGSFCNRLPQPSTVRFASILWADARSCGLSQHRLDVWGIIAPLRPGEAPATPVPLSSLPPINKTLVLIGERVYEGGNFPPFAYRSPSGEMLFLHPRHIALKLRNNPLVLDMLWLHGHEPEINIQIPFGTNTLTTTQLAKYSGDLCKQMPVITQYLIPKVGRPEGVAIPPAQFEKMKKIAIKSRERGDSWEKVAEDLDIKDQKTLKGYREIWGIK